MPDRTKWTPAALVLLAVVVLMALPQSPAVAGPVPVRSAVPTEAQVAAQQIALARGSLSNAALPLAPHPLASTHPVWSDLSSKIPSAPSPRYLAAMVYDPVDHYVVLFGGYGSSGALSDTWTYAGGVWTQVASGASPPSRYAAFSTWDASDGYVLLFGGYDSSTGSLLNDTWTFVGGAWTQLSPTASPSPRWRGALAYDPTDKYVVLYGGGSDLSTATTSDTWKFHAGAWTNLTKNVTGKPGGLFRQEATTDWTDGYVVMFGGCTSQTCSSPSSATWTYENLTWTKQAPTTSPAGRAYEGLTFDNATGTVLLFGGDNYATGAGDSDTWEYVGGNWTSLTAQLTRAPSARAFEGLTYDASDGYAVLFGGQNPSSGSVWFNDTWAFGPSVITSLNVAPASIDLGQAVTLNATPFAFNGYVNASYAGLPPGCASANVTVLTCTPTQLGTYLVSVTENDSLGSPVTRFANLTVGPDPAITAYAASLGALTAGSTVWFNVTVVNGSPAYHYAYSGLPQGCASSSTPNLACTPGSTARGSYTVEVNANDAAGFHVYDNTSVLVNAKPSVVSFRATRSTVDAGQPISLYANTSGGTAPLAYFYGNLPAGCASTDTAVLHCAPTGSGTYPVNVTVTDSFAWSATATLNLQVNPDPSITSFVASPTAFDLGHGTTIYLNATGGTGTLIYSYVGLPPGCILGAAATGSCTPTSNGTFTVQGTALDTLNFAVHTTLTLVVAGDPLMTAVVATPSEIDAGQSFKLTSVVSGGTGPFVFSYTGLPPGCSGGTTANVTCQPHQAGGLTITAVVTDAWKLSSQLAQTVTVDADPSVTAFTASAASASLGGTVTLAVGVSGGSGVYTYVYSNLPAGCASANASSLPCTPTSAGSYNVSVNVTDSAGISTHAYTTFSITSGSSGGSSFGLSGSGGFLLVALVVVVALVAAVAVLVLRRRRGSSPAPAAEAPAAPPAESWQEEPNP